MGERNGGISTAHVLTRTVRDSAAVLDFTAGPEPGSPYAVPPAAGPFADSVDRGVEGLTVAVADGFPLGCRVAPQCEHAVNGATHLLKERGAIVVEATPNIDFAAVRQALAILFAGHLAAGLSGHKRQPLEEGLEPLTLALVDHGLSLNALDYIAAVETCQHAARLLGLFFETYDALLTPALAAPTPRLGFLSMATNDWSAHLTGIFDFVGYMPLFNATGTPAAVLPFDWTSDDLPIAVHIGAALGREDVLFAIAGTLERYRPWDSDRLSKLYRAGL
jgi:Asp-tRNA(Asn)/Glu-tRNA(Gln) amidotransferase A subunit family amidase